LALKVLKRLRVSIAYHGTDLIVIVNLHEASPIMLAYLLPDTGDKRAPSQLRPGIPVIDLGYLPRRDKRSSCIGPTANGHIPYI